MTTNDRYMNVTTKRLMGASDFGTRFVEYMRSQAEETNRRTYDADTFLKDGVTISADGNDKFRIVPDSSGVIAADGDGHFLDTTLSSYMTGIQFENASAIPYHVGLKYSEAPYEIQINPRTGYPEYVAYEEYIGDSEKPNSVVDNGGTITFVVNDATETGADCTGRYVMVWMVNPATGASTAAIAIETCLVTYSGGQNKITTVGTLGQTTVSTTGSDYLAMLLGPSVKRYTDLRTEDGYAYVGKITGAGAGNPPTTFDHSNQRVVPYSWVSALVDGLPQDFIPAVDNTYNLGSASRRWASIYTANLIFSGDFLPPADDTHDLGSPSFRWQNLYMSSDAVMHDILPETDGTYDLGSSSYEWQDLHVDGTAYLDKLSLSGAGGEGAISNLVPAVTDSYDLGNGSYKWQDLFIDGTATIDTLSLSAVAGEGVSSHFVPSADDSSNLGNGSYEWQDLHLDGVAYVDTLYPSAIAGEGVMNHLVPATGDTHDLGNSSYEWKDLFIDGIAYIDTLSLSITAGEGVATSLIPTVTDTHDLGHADYEWDDLFLAKLNLSVTAGEGCVNGLMPATGALNLGSGTYEWNHGYFDGIVYMDALSISFVAGEGCTTDFVPSSDGVSDLGNTNYEWQDLHIDGTAYIDTLAISVTGGEGIGSKLMPTAGDTYDMGDATYYWGDIYCDNLYYKTAHATFDNEDDLALIEAYQPTMASRPVEKGGKMRTVYEGDASTIPWPMLGPICPNDGLSFIDPGDSLFFLLGAMKQLYQHHKAENKRLEGIIESLAGRIKTIEATV